MYFVRHWGNTLKFYIIEHRVGGITSTIKLYIKLDTYNHTLIVQVKDEIKVTFCDDFSSRSHTLLNKHVPLMRINCLKTNQNSVNM